MLTTRGSLVVIVVVIDVNVICGDIGSTTWPRGLHHQRIIIVFINSWRSAAAGDKQRDAFRRWFYKRMAAKTTSSWA